MTLYRVLRLGVSAGLLLFLGYLLDWRAVTSTLLQVSLPLLILGLMMNVGATVVSRAIFSWYLVDPHQRPKLSRVIVTFWILRFYSVILPKAVVLAVRWKHIQNVFGRSSSYSAAIISYDALISCLVMSFGAFIFAMVEFKVISNPHVWVVVSGISTVFFVTILMFAKGSAARSMLQIVRRLAPESQSFNKIIHHASSLQNNLSEISVHRSVKRSLVLMGCSLLFYFGFVASGYLLFLAIGGDISFSGISWIRSIVWIATMLPVSVGGVGVREAGFAFFLADYGYAVEFAVAYAVIAYVVQALIGLIGGFLDVYQSALVKGNVSKG